MTRQPPRSPLFPYTTLFRSARRGARSVVALEWTCLAGTHADLRCAAGVAPVTPSRPRVVRGAAEIGMGGGETRDRKSTRLNSSHLVISDSVFLLKKKNENGY